MGNSEKRPCLVGKDFDRKAVFHRWVEVAQIVSPSIMNGGHGGGVVKDIVALVELEDGTVREFLPENIRFTDSDRLFAEVYRGGGEEDDSVGA